MSRDSGASYSIVHQIENHRLMVIQPNSVFCTKAPASSYCSYRPKERFPELPEWAEATTALVTLRSLLIQAGLDRLNYGSREWNPLGTLISVGDKVIVKPNWVHHSNGSGQGLDCLVTHTSVIEAILHYVAKASPESIVVGDAPIQGCDFKALMADCNVPPMAERFIANGVNIVLKDFRRTILKNEKLGSQAQEECQPIEHYILYNLGCESSLEAITNPSKSEFRVTMYNPDWMKRTHAPGKHQYLVARDVIDADVVINVPKLKTHKKACITGALKNIVGINGHKEYLPHHRKGGSQNGGDCYPGQSRLKSLVEELLDAVNRAQHPVVRQVLANATRAGMALGKLVGTDNNYDGSWYGNDTVWRMALDLQRVLHYGATDGTLSNHVQRKVLTITDAIIAGQGEGPLSPTPIEFGLMTLGVNAAAIDWVHALLMGLVPEQIPLTREAFLPRCHSLADFGPEQILVRVNGQPVPAGELFVQYGQAFRLPSGWRGHFQPGGLENPLSQFEESA
jgi:uncharacterized protein (DUF362 family)